MGYEIVEGYFSASLSRHNSQKDKEDGSLWLDFVNRIKEIADEEKYSKIFLTVGANVEVI